MAPAGSGTSGGPLNRPRPKYCAVVQPVNPKRDRRRATVLSGADQGTARNGLRPSPAGGARADPRGRREGASHELLPRQVVGRCRHRHRPGPFGRCCQARRRSIHLHTRLRTPAKPDCPPTGVVPAPSYHPPGWFGTGNRPGIPVRYAGGPGPLRPGACRSGDHPDGSCHHRRCGRHPAGRAVRGSAAGPGNRLVRVRPGPRRVGRVPRNPGARTPAPLPEVAVCRRGGGQSRPRTAPFTVPPGTFGTRSSLCLRLHPPRPDGPAARLVRADGLRRAVQVCEPPHRGDAAERRAREGARRAGRAGEDHPRATMDT
jgi:hypothetical protein